jgi:DNA-binding NtrC family response regulator
MGKSLNILVVDDDVDNARSLAELFEMDNHKVIVAHDGQQAIEAFSLNKVDIGFFDVMMPVKNGVESFLEIKATYPEACIYFMTGFSAADLINRAMKGGARGVFSKPVDLLDILGVVENAA